MEKFFHSFELELETFRMEAWLADTLLFFRFLVVCKQVDLNNSNVRCWFCAWFSHRKKVHSWFAERGTWYHKKEIVVFCVFFVTSWDENFVHIIRYFDCCYHQITSHSFQRRVGIVTSFCLFISDLDLRQNSLSMTWNFQQSDSRLSNASFWDLNVTLL